MADQPTRSEEESGDRPADVSSPAPATPARRRGTAWTWIVSAVLVLAVVGAVIYFTLASQRSAAPPPDAQSSEATTAAPPAPETRETPAPTAAPASAAGPPAPGVAERLAAIEEKLTTFESVLGAAQRGQADQIAAMVSRMQGIERYLGDIGPKVDRRGVDPATADAIKTLGERLTAIEKRIAALGESGAAAAQGAASEEALGALRQDIDGRLAAMTKAQAQLTADIASRLGAAEAAAEKAQRSETRADQAGAVVLAVGQLRESLRSPRPFVTELEAVRALAGGREGYAEPLDALAPHAAGGVPTREALALRFEPLAQAGARAAITPDGAGWLDHTLARLSSLVTIRRTGEDETDTRPTAHIARAEARLDLGDLAGAVAALEPLRGAPAAVFADWLADARARLAVDRAGATLTSLALADLGSATSAATNP